MMTLLFHLLLYINSKIIQISIFYRLKQFKYEVKQILAIEIISTDRKREHCGQIIVFQNLRLT